MTNAKHPDRPDLATRLAQPFGEGSGSITPPIYQTSLFGFEDFDSFADAMAGRNGLDIYTRVGNPTTRTFEEMMASAEQTDAAIGFASGMGAVSAVAFAFLKPGDRIAAVEHLYPDAYRLFERLLRPFGIHIDYHPVSAFEDDPDLMRGCRLAYLESPTSIMLQTADLARIAAHARRHDCLTVIDNSWATPVFQRPATLGIDVVLHSASKYISGHSDTVAGVVCTNQDLTDRIRDISLPLLGGKLAPFEAWLLIRGMRTLAARMQTHQATANLFVERLADLPHIIAVNTPDPGSVPGLDGRSGLLSVAFAPTIDMKAFVDGLSLFKPGVSWGGFESLVLPASVALGQKGEQNALQRFGVPASLVRLSLGLESSEDLWTDFTNAFHQAGSAQRVPVQHNKNGGNHETATDNTGRRVLASGDIGGGGHKPQAG